MYIFSHQNSIKNILDLTLMIIFNILILYTTFCNYASHVEYLAGEVLGPLVDPTNQLTLVPAPCWCHREAEASQTPARGHSLG